MLPAQCKMARAALGLSVRELAELADLSADTVTRFEAGEAVKPRTVGAIQQALEAAGVEFLGGSRPGVRIRDHWRISRRGPCSPTLPCYMRMRMIAISITLEVYEAVSTTLPHGKALPAEIVLRMAKG